jgi:hypothetical protein
MYMHSLNLTEQALAFVVYSGIDANGGRLNSNGTML